MYGVNKGLCDKQNAQLVHSVYDVKGLYSRGVDFVGALNFIFYRTSAELVKHTPEAIMERMRLVA